MFVKKITLQPQVAIKKILALKQNQSNHQKHDYIDLANNEGGFCNSHIVYYIWK